MSARAEAVRVICRCRPIRSQLLKGGQVSLDDGNAPALSGKAKIVKRQSVAPGNSKGKENEKRSSLPTGNSLVTPPPLSDFGLKFTSDGKGIALFDSSKKNHSFSFDEVFGPDSVQSDVFNAVAKETVADVLKGYNGCIFAYGQTGSGKTHSMFGPSNSSPSLRGLIPRCADSLFAGIEASTEIEEATIKCSFLEIYKEVIQDLLHSKNSNLKIRETPQGEVYVQGLSDEYVSSADDILALLQLGEKHRTVASTSMNETSSRSHSVLIIIVTQKLRDGSTRTGKLNLADLAGSERLERTHAEGSTLEEAKKINQSLSALGNCINALTDSKRSHIPFRDSTLTFLLKDSLGGNTKTTLLVCCSGEESDLPETLSTLQFAKRAKQIKNTVTVNTQLGVKELNLLVENLRHELALAHKQIIALQKIILQLQKGNEIDESTLKILMAAPVNHVDKEISKPHSNATKDEEVKEPVSEAASSNHQEERKEEETYNQIESRTEDEDKPSISPETSSTPLSPFNETVIEPTTPLPLQPTSPSLLTSSVPSSPSPSPSTPITLHDIDVNPLRSSSATAFVDVDGALALPNINSSSTDERQVSNPSPNSPPSNIGQNSIIEPRTPTYDSSILPPSDLPSALTTISQLATTLQLTKQHYKNIKRQLQLENAQLRVEKELLKINVNNPTPKNKPDSLITQTSSNGSYTEEYVSDLRSKNENLEKQMHEMKVSWTAYLAIRDVNEAEKHLFPINKPAPPPSFLIEERQKAKIVVPVRKQSGTFTSPARAVVPVGATPLWSAKDAESRRNSSTFQPTKPNNVTSSTSSGQSSKSGSGFVTPAASISSSQRSFNTSEILSSLLSSPINKPLFPFGDDPKSPPQTNLFGSSSSSTSSTYSPPPFLGAVSRTSMDYVIKRGYLLKKSAGWSLSISRTWRKRLCLLRPTCLDIYDVNNNNNNNAVSTNNVSSATNAPPNSTSSEENVDDSMLLGTVRGSFPIDSVTTIALLDIPDAAYSFELRTRDKECRLSASSPSERDSWMDEIRNVIRRLRNVTLGGNQENNIGLESGFEKKDALGTVHPTRVVEIE